MVAVEQELAAAQQVSAEQTSALATLTSERDQLSAQMVALREAEAEVQRRASDWRGERCRQKMPWLPVRRSMTSWPLRPSACKQPSPRPGPTPSSLISSSKQHAAHAQSTEQIAKLQAKLDAADAAAARNDERIAELTSARDAVQEQLDYRGA